MPTAFRMLLIEKQNAIVCRACGQFMSVYTKSVRRGVTPETLAVFLAQLPAPEPTVVDMAKHKKLSPEQLVNRLLAAKGGWTLTLSEYDQRVGSSGPVIDPDTGSEWVKTEDSPSDTNEENRQSDRLMVGGVMCVVVDGAWVPVESE
jgi:hypothetical protein